MISKIELRDIKFYAFHGVMPQETIVGNNFVINIIITTCLEKAIASDKIEDTINYASIYSVIADEMNISSKLLEHVAGRILYSLKNRFPQITEIELTLSKLNPPIGVDIHSASVILKEIYT